MNVYIHVPFCRSKCGYCAFYSEAGAGADARRAYLEKLRRDLTARVWDEPVDTLYFGGGTPTLLTVAELEILFDLAEALPLAPGAERSMEANPETLTPEKIALLREHVTRISLGVQSFFPGVRERLGRDCSDRALDAAISGIRAARFPHFSMDLMYGVPGETPEIWRRDLERALASGIDHHSCYALTPEEGTRLAGTGVDDELAETLYETVLTLGLPRYEVSNFARPGAECRHNAAVWRGGLLRGFGPAAASFENGVRTIEPASLTRWLADDAPEIDEIPLEARYREILAVNLRTTDGWTPGSFAAIPLGGKDRFNWDWAQRVCAEIPADFLCVRCDRIAPTSEGLRFWNEMAERLI